MKVSNLADAAPVFLIHIKSQSENYRYIPEMEQRDTKETGTRIETLQKNMKEPMLLHSTRNLQSQ